MAELLDDVCCASIPAESLPALAGLRARRGVRVKWDNGLAWVFWTAGDAAVLRRVASVRRAAVFARSGAFWVRPGHSLPAFGVPDETETKTLAEALFPEPVHPLIVERPAFQPVRLTLASDDHPRPATALMCRLDALARWADGVPASRLASLTAAVCDGLSLVRGDRLPELPDAERYWGGAVLTPLGCRPEPALSDRELGRALGLGNDDLALLSPEGAEVIDGGLFRPLTRAGLRLAMREGG